MVESTDTRDPCLLRDALRSDSEAFFSPRVYLIRPWWRAWPNERGGRPAKTLMSEREIAKPSSLRFSFRQHSSPPLQPACLGRKSSTWSLTPAAQVGVINVVNPWSLV